MTATRRLASATLIACAAAVPLPSLAANTNPHASAFVVLYQCDGDDWLAVGYPAPFASGTEPPARVSWNGSTVVMSQARSGSGARYANAGESIVFWNKGDTAFLEENGKTTFAGCATAR